jgi:hypothetical protein
VKAMIEQAADSLQVLAPAYHQVARYSRAIGPLACHWPRGS